MSMRIPVIIDTDIGDDIDDAFALCLAMQSPEIEILGVTLSLIHILRAKSDDEEQKYKGTASPDLEGQVCLSVPAASVCGPDSVFVLPSGAGRLPFLF